MSVPVTILKNYLTYYNNTTSFVENDKDTILCRSILSNINKYLTNNSYEVILTKKDNSNFTSYYLTICIVMSNMKKLVFSIVKNTDSYYLLYDASKNNVFLIDQIYGLKYLNRNIKIIFEDYIKESIDKQIPIIIINEKESDYYYDNMISLKSNQKDTQLILEILKKIQEYKDIKLTILSNRNKILNNELPKYYYISDNYYLQYSIVKTTDDYYLMFCSDENGQNKKYILIDRIGGLRYVLRHIKIID